MYYYSSPQSRLQPLQKSHFIYYIHSTTVYLYKNKKMEQFFLNKSEKKNLYLFRFDYLIFIKYIIYKIIGLSPWSLNIHKVSNKNHRINNDKNNIFDISYAGTFYNILLIILINSLNIYSFGSFFPVQVDTVLTPTIMNIINFVLVLSVTAIMTIYVTRQSIIINVMNKLIRVEENLKNCGYYKAESYLTIYLMIIFNFLLTTGMLATGIYKYSLLGVFIKLLPIIISSWVLIQYSTFLYIINKKFESVNTTISNFGKMKNSSQLQPIFMTKTGLLTESVYHEIENLKFVYGELCDICQNIEDFYGLPALIAIVKFGETIIRSSYYILVSLDYSVPDKLLAYVISGIGIVWTSLILMILTTFVVRTIKQSQKTANIINRLMDRCTMDPKIKEQRPPALESWVHSL
ncbi:uncharacterized protein LOC130663423 isoform X2 [Microplitis mediator]|uniref:uncharacterized protein LOC130663423 isoform X2 n=1 Tax=Microplitis mediator TaxID=375433 RepID=UPI0025527A09|nr:uncharacterized protein LOC130663423 isoform X2 [Microplitis mediator]